MENNDTIAAQRLCAVEILEKLSLTDPSAVLAGGAVRDWRFNSPAKDLDFYLRTPNHNTIQLQTDFLSTIGFISIEIVEANDPIYQHMNDILRVYQADYEEYRCNIMIMSDKTFNCWYGFSNSLCECFMKKDGVFCYTANFERSLLEKTVFVKTGYTLHHPHISKMMQKFPDFTFDIHPQDKEVIAWLM